MEGIFVLFSLGRNARMSLAAGLFALGALVHILFPWGTAPGFALILAGYLPLLLKKITNKPKDKGLEEWRPVSMAEVDKISDSLAQTRKKRYGTAAGTAGKVILGFLGVAAAAVSFALDARLGLLAADAALFFVPALYFGNLRFFLPPLLSRKMPCFQAVFAAAARDGFAATPYLRFDKDEEGKDVPEDIRLMLEPKRKPEGFVGVQFQAAINKGPNGEVPYLYAVFLFKGTGAEYKRISSISARGYHIEPSAKGEYATVVVRQATTGTGYLTRPSDCERLYATIAAMLEKAGLGG
ncbi:MAG: hypothetical protein AB1407_11095 [Spirochaetota bacterium]